MGASRAGVTFLWSWQRGRELGMSQVECAFPSGKGGIEEGQLFSLYEENP